MTANIKNFGIALPFRKQGLFRVYCAGGGAAGGAGAGAGAGGAGVPPPPPDIELPAYAPDVGFTVSGFSWRLLISVSTGTFGVAGGGVAVPVTFGPGAAISVPVLAGKKGTGYFKAGTG